MQRAFRRYHRFLALLLALPILLTVMSGTAFTIMHDWLGLSARWLLHLHTGEIFHLETIYPVLNGLGLIGLLITGLSMSGGFRSKPRSAEE
jgi:hypothetical protein